AFPIPQDGLEAVWNHITRYRGGSARRVVAQAPPQGNGSYRLARFVDAAVYTDSLTDDYPETHGDVLLHFTQQLTDPPRPAAHGLLVHETLDPVKEPRMAWIYNAGQRRVRRAPQVAYAGPGTAADGLRPSDNLDMFNGAPDRYEWKL